MAVLLETSKGDLTIDLFVNETPKAVTNFLKCGLRGCGAPHHLAIGHHPPQPPTLPARSPTGSAKPSTTTTASSSTSRPTLSPRRATPPTPAAAASRCGACCMASRRGSSKMRSGQASSTSGGAWWGWPVSAARAEGTRGHGRGRARVAQGAGECKRAGCRRARGAAHCLAARRCCQLHAGGRQVHGLNSPAVPPCAGCALQARART